MATTNVKVASATTTDTTATEAPTAAPTSAPAVVVTEAPTPAPTEAVTEAPTSNPDDLIVTPVVTEAPTAAPTAAPTQKPTAAPTAAPKAAAKATVVEASKPVAANAPVVEKLASILKNVPPANQIDINRIQIYIEKMAPRRPIDAKVGVAEQVALYRSIQNIINRQEDYFTQLFSALLFLFKTEGATGALSDRYRMRFMENVTLPVGDRKAFANITAMLHILADPASRAIAMKQVNLERALENGLTAEGRDRVLNYFGA